MQGEVWARWAKAKTCVEHRRLSAQSPPIQLYSYTGLLLCKCLPQPVCLEANSKPKPPSAGAAAAGAPTSCARVATACVENESHNFSFKWHLPSQTSRNACAPSRALASILEHWVARRSWMRCQILASRTSSAAQVQCGSWAGVAQPQRSYGGNGAAGINELKRWIAELLPTKPS